MTTSTFSHVASVVIIHPEDENDSRIFVELKGEGHPDPSARGGVSILGGNWEGEESAIDAEPIDTLARRLNTELQLPEDAHLEDVSALDELKTEILRIAVPYGAYANLPSKESTSTHKDVGPALIYVWVSPLDENSWTELERLQEKYGNLSVDYASTAIISLDDMMSGRVSSAFGNDRRLRSFWFLRGFNEALNLPVGDEYENIDADNVPWFSYTELLGKFDVINTPST